MLPTCPLPPGRTIRRWFLTANLGNLLIGASKNITCFLRICRQPDPLSALPALTRAKHNPWVNFSNVSSASNQPFTSFTTNFTTLATISFVIPNLTDMHDGTILQADTWLQNAGQARSVWRDH
jgi:acid phosphatase